MWELWFRKLTYTGEQEIGNLQNIVQMVLYRKKKHVATEWEWEYNEFKKTGDILDLVIFHNRWGG